jgi:hypothetical protein
MGKGQRHSKNAGTMGSESLTYAERRALGFGTVTERLGKVGVVQRCSEPCTLGPTWHIHAGFPRQLLRLLLDPSTGRGTAPCCWLSTLRVILHR